jgi:hypothetical protein
VKRKAYHQTLKQQTPPHHILVVKTALNVGQPQKVPKHAQQVAKYGLKFCAKKTYHESKHLSPPSSPSNPSFVIEEI